MKICRVCNIEKKINEFYLSKPYCKLCTETKLKQYKPGQLRSAKGIKRLKKEKISLKYCVFCNSFTEKYYRENKLTRYVCLSCKVLLDGLIEHRTARLLRRAESAEKKYLELKYELNNYKENIKEIVKISKMK